MANPDPLKSPKLFLRFWFEAFKEAFGKGWAMSGIASAVIPDLLVVIGQTQFLEQVEFFKWMHGNQNLMRLYCVAAVILAYLIYAPYRKYRETQIHAFESMKKAWDRLNVAGEEITRLKVQLDHEEQVRKEKRRRRELADKLAILMDNGRALASLIITKDETAPSEEEEDEWFGKTYAALAFSPTSSIHVSRFNLAQHTSGTVVIGATMDESRRYNHLMSKVRILEEFIKELMQSPS